jgi:glucose/arabinose dehydrogenase
VIWRQAPKVSGRGHYGGRIVFDADGKLWLSSSERQKFDPAQDMASNPGKVLRLNDDGTPAAGNLFAERGGVSAQMWEIEMGPRGGDELNLIERGANYGYPIVSNGDHYDGRPIPDHDTRPDFVAPKVSWSPVVSPSSLIIYSGGDFPGWRGNALISGLSSQSLVRVALDGDNAREVARYDMNRRIRAVAQGPDGTLWLLEDGSKGRLLKLEARR